MFYNTPSLFGLHGVLLSCYSSILSECSLPAWLFKLHHLLLSVYSALTTLHICIPYLQLLTSNLHLCFTHILNWNHLSSYLPHSIMHRQEIFLLYFLLWLLIQQSVQATKWGSWVSLWIPLSPKAITSNQSQSPLTSYMDIWHISPPHSSHSTTAHCNA